MSNIKKTRRDFLSFKKSGVKSQDISKNESSSPEMVSMLTPDGKLVLVRKDVLESINLRKQVNNAEILDWRQGPDKV